MKKDAPKTIFIGWSSWRMGNTRLFSCEKTRYDDIEYHLAPVWHEMEKDSPPDSDNLVLTKVKGKVWWYLLPPVPERSGE
jgi:hypothetical protein